MSNNEVKKLNVLVADDHPFFCESLADLIKLALPVDIVDTAYDGESVLVMLSRYEYDFLFLDIDMPVLNGIDTLRKIRKTNKKIHVIMVSMHSRYDYFTELHELGINGYILKNINIEDLRRAIALISDGGEFYSREILENIHKSIHIEKHRHVFIQEKEALSITDREKEVLAMICEQLSAKEIADKLNISERTVKRHKESLLEKTGSINQIGLALFAIKQGIKAL